MLNRLLEMHNEMFRISEKEIESIVARSKGLSPADLENVIELLNGVRKSDGSVRDTSTEILKGRRDAYDRARRMMENLNRSGKCTSASVKKIMDNLFNKEEREEYVGVKLYYFGKKYNALVRRGL